MQKILWLVVTCALAMMPLAAHAQDADELVDAGRAAFEAGDYEEAAVQFQTAFDLDPHPVLLTNLARAHEAAGHLPLARALYEDVLYMEGGNELEEIIDARIQSIEEELIAMGYNPARLRQEDYVPRGTLTVTSSPDGASVFIDEEFVGRTPWRSEWVDEGPVRLALRLDGYHTLYAEVDIIGREASGVSYQLVDQQSLDTYVPPEPGLLTIVTGGEGLQVFLDGEPWAETPVRERRLAPGRYEVRIQGEDPLDRYTEMINVASGEEAIVNAFLTDQSLDPGASARSMSSVLLGTGAALTAGGAIFGVLAYSAANSYESQPDSPDRVSYRDAARRNAIIADVMLVGGIGSLAVGTVLRIAGDRASRRFREEAEQDDLLILGPGPGTIGVSLSGRF